MDIFSLLTCPSHLLHGLSGNISLHSPAGEQIHSPLHLLIFNMGQLMR